MPSARIQSYDQIVASSALPRLEARMLLEHLSGRSREWLIAHGDDPADVRIAEQFAALSDRRWRGEPMSYLVGEREFFGRLFQVTPDVLIPRPETELLVERALVCCPKDGQVIDLGTGSACIAVSLACERDDLRLLATDCSVAALGIAMANARRHCPAKLSPARPGMPAPLRFEQSDWWQSVPPAARFDLIVSNPPYIPADDPHLALGDLRFEPQSALTDAADGLSALAAIVAGAHARLKSGGWILLEHGFDQAAAVRKMLEAAGFCEVVTLVDGAGRDRLSEGRAT